jgi:hypothetical protein
MSELRVDNIVSQDGTAAPVYSKGILIGSGQTITNQGDFIVEGSSTLQGSVNITNTGITTVAGTLDVTSTGISTFTGNVWVGGAGTITGSLDVLGGGTLNTAGVITASLIDVTSEIQYANLSILTGNAGIGTTSGLGGRLNVNDDIVMSTGIGSVFDMAIRTYALDGGAISFEQVDGSDQFFSVSKDETSIVFAVNDASFTAQFVVGAGGSVGIGTTNPLSKLDVRGDARVGLNTSQGVILTSPNGTLYRLSVDNSGTLTTTAV